MHGDTLHGASKRSLGRGHSVEPKKQERRGESQQYPRRFLGLHSGGRSEALGQTAEIVGIVLVICAVVAVLVAANSWINSGKIYGGVEVGGVSLGGKAPEEAREVVEDRIAGDLEGLELTGPEELTLDAEELGTRIDAQATVDRAYAVGRRGSLLEQVGDRLQAARGTVRISPAMTYERERLRDALADVYDTLEVEPIEAGFGIRDGRIHVTESRTGQNVDEEELLNDIEAGLLEGQREFEIPMVTTEPELTTVEAQALKPMSLIGSYRTDYTLSSDKSPERVENLKIASSAISGTVLAPGEVFSMNAVAQPLEYYETKVIIEGREELADGGGLCQVSSTLYMAANYAGLDIVERNPHSAELPYIRPGLDATVWFGSLDMKFENTTDGYVLIREYVADDGYIYAEVWGRPTGKEVEMDSEPLYVGSDSATWVTYQKVKEDGKVIFDDVLYKDTYMPLVDEAGELVQPGSVVPVPVNY